MYPQVFADFQKFLANYDRLTGLPTTAFFYGLRVGEEIAVEIQPGKILFVKLISINEPDAEGVRTIFYELNGMPRESQVVDQARAPKDSTARRKGDASDPLQAVAPMPGMVTEVAVGTGHVVKEGEPVVTLEAMKMLTTISADQDGVVKEVLVTQGDAVDTDDLLIVLEEA